MAHASLDLTDDLTDLIRLQRTDVTKLTQKGAATAANVSVVWWRQIETGTARTATDDTLARMCYAIDISPAQLRKIGQQHLAGLVERRRELLEPEPDGDVGAEAALEAHLQATPVLNRRNVTVLVSVALGLLQAERDELAQSALGSDYSRPGASITALPHSGGFER